MLSQQEHAWLTAVVSCHRARYHRQAVRQGHPVDVLDEPRIHPRWQTAPESPARGRTHQLEALDDRLLTGPELSVYGVPKPNDRGPPHMVADASTDLRRDGLGSG